MSGVFLFLQGAVGGELTLTDGDTAPDRTINGIPLEADGSVAIDSVGGVETYSQGLPITFAGRIAYTEITDNAEFSSGIGYVGGRVAIIPGASTGSGPPGNWILAAGSWNDGGVWEDTAVWND